jgi:hypothetical protein
MPKMRAADFWKEGKSYGLENNAGTSEHLNKFSSTLSSNFSVEARHRD